MDEISGNIIRHSSNTRMRANSRFTNFKETDRYVPYQDIERSRGDFRERFKHPTIVGGNIETRKYKSGQREWNVGGMIKRINVSSLEQFDRMTNKNDNIKRAVINKMTNIDYGDFDESEKISDTIAETLEDEITKKDGEIDAEYDNNPRRVRRTKGRKERNYREAYFRKLNKKSDSFVDKVAEKIKLIESAEKKYGVDLAKLAIGNTKINPEFTPGLIQNKK